MQETVFPDQAPEFASPVELSRKPTREWMIDAWWLLFMIIASGVGVSFVSDNVQRLFWLAADVIVIVAFLLAPKVYLGYARDIPILMSWPALAVLSTMWSLTPGLSAYHGLQLVATYLVGFFFFDRYGLEKTGKLLFITIAAGAVLSVMVIAINHPLSRDFAGTWIGVYNHKNTLGSMMGFEIILGLLLVWAGWHRILVSAVIAIAVVLLISSHSANAIMVVGLIVPTIFPLAFSVRQGPQTTGIFVGLSLTALCIIGAILLTYQIDLFHLVLDAFDKDDSLSGRTTLWAFGMDSFWQNPILGIGYKAYWESAATTSSLLGAVLSQELKSFHNNLLDVAVALGSVGVIAFVLGLGSTFLAAVRVYLRGPSPLALWPLAFTMFVIIAGYAEYPLFYNHGLYQLLIAAVGVGLQEERRRQRENAIQPTTEVTLRVAPTSSTA